MPKWWAISWMTVSRTVATTSASDVAGVADRPHEDRDAIGHDEGVPVVALGERDPLVEAEELARRALVVEDDGHVVHRRGQLVGQVVEGARPTSSSKRSVDRRLMGPCSPRSAETAIAPRCGR